MMSYMIEQSIERLKNAGIRITPQRYGVLEYLIETDSHPTADDIYKALKGRFPNMSVATVYNNLRVFIQHNLVKELNYGDASSRFDFNSTEHYHAVCTQCGKIEDVYYPGLEKVEKAAEELTGFVITSHRMELYGLCEDCQREKSLL